MSCNGEHFCRVLRVKVIYLYWTTQLCYIDNAFCIVNSELDTDVFREALSGLKPPLLFINETDNDTVLSF